MAEPDQQSQQGGDATTGPMALVDPGGTIRYLADAGAGSARPGQPATTLVEPEARTALAQAIESVLAGGPAVTLPTGRTDPAGRPERLRAFAMPGADGALVALARIDGLAAARQAALERSEERVRTLVEFAPEAITIFDVDTGRFVDVNGNACELFGMTREALLRCGPQDVSPEFQPDGSPSAQAAGYWLGRAIDGEHSVFEWQHRSSDGREIPCEVRLIRLPDPERRRVRGSIIDISRRKQADEERARLTLELAQAQKLQAIGQLTGGVAHDFNNLLTVIMSSLELIELQPEDVERVLGHTRQALRASERAAALTQQLLAFARRQPLRPRDVDLNDLVRDTEALLARTLGEAIEVETRLALDLWTCRTDPTQLENAILNLAINARDAMPQGGRLVLTTANAAIGGGDTAAYPGMEPGEYVRLTVADTGAGMGEDVLRHVFEPFFTTKEAGQGSGLGLSMVYGFVRQSGGHVHIHSRPGAGTTVTVHLPRRRADADEVDRGGFPDATPAGRGESVLVVEDDPAVRRLVTATLEGLGYRTVGAADATAALQTLRRRPDVDLLLSDVVLAGGRHGPELAREALALLPGLPVLFMSGYSEEAASGRGGLEAGLMLEKPFTRHRLAVAVRRALDGDGPSEAGS